ncbi:2-polyprenyl-6-methoxyphenol hydroxylase-like FAD-dependent oxidoreductase [Saccharothrix tamanrassetensis]|uniref:2-polyprenyl-6-methoxyphenol hydroxylase-like FAD-dependent oxidoreductase n=1 Tax=Saccharothrix tamanrassetensis TaxID=1051531 RepID=A0A841CER0_9PSEU|nr:FAD-dependent oxidoreductase [Saccharothrix tamanrassetensis]MBB5954637.1 2-polyprenyl-6-methoxyphenol hydroxylase-like FAD-dependent oxidoreductase [Saccharothrix tamanrassetensis]
MRAAVIGGGIGGLTAAIGLHESGWEVTVYERCDALPATGTGLGIWRNAIEALDNLGLGAAARRAGREQPDGTLRKPDGSVIGPLRADVHLLTRPALLTLLADALPSNAIRFGTPMTWQECDHDLIVGADGINSATRRSLFGVEVRHSGAIGWRGTVDLEVAAGGETWGRGVKFGLTPQADGRTNWYAMTGPDAELEAVFGDWHDPIPRVLAESTEILRHPLDYLPPLPAYYQDRIVLLGDAAHAMTPDLGQGACQAIIDAVTLAEHVTPDNIPAGLENYDKARRRSTQRMVKQSLALNRLARMRRFTGVRDTVLKAALALAPKPRQDKSWSADLESDELAG